MTQDQLLGFLSNVRIVYVGEVHTNLMHHRVQLEILKGLEERFPGKIAVGMEMLDQPSQPVLDQWSRGEIDEKSFVKTWYENWNQDYGYYKDILHFIREKRIPLRALNVPDEQVHELTEKGLEGLASTVREGLPATAGLPELDPKDPYHFYQTMLLWDETMAQNIVHYLLSPEGQGKKIIVLAGRFHVGYGFGIPQRAFRRLPEPYAIVMPHTSTIPKGREHLLMDVTPPKLPLYLADFVWSVGYEDLEEEEVRLGIEIEQKEK